MKKKSRTKNEEIDSPEPTQEPIKANKIFIETEDLKIDILSNAGEILNMRIIHVPTGSSVSGKGVFQYRLQKELTEKLTSIVKLI
jgi:hypothetical protein